MRDFRNRHDGFAGHAANFTIGAATGLALGIFLSRGLSRRRLETDFRGRAKRAVRRLRPARLQRFTEEIEELEALEDAVLNRFLSDSLLSARAIDIGAISPGIIELTGTVASEAEADQAVQVAHAVAGVHSVVNRLDVDGLGRPRATMRRVEVQEVGDSTFVHQESRVGGMGRRRQNPATDPGRPDESQQMREDALAAADRDQWRDEGIAHGSGVTDERPEPEVMRPRGFAEDELDNQYPHSGRLPETPEEGSEGFRSAGRVAEPPKPGIQTEPGDEEMPLDRSSDEGTT